MGLILPEVTLMVAPARKAFPVKHMPHDQSRRNSARPRRKVTARHARARRCDAQPTPMLSPGKVSYEIGGNIHATSFGGVAAAHRLTGKVGLAL